MALEKEKIDLGIKAVKAFNNLIPNLTSYARAITGDRKIRVEAVSTGPSAAFYSSRTNIIYVIPPLELAEVRRHNRILCDKRNSKTLQQLCKACRVREYVYAMVYHEIGHACFKSGETFDDYEKAQFIKRLGSVYGGELASRFEKKTSSAPKWVTNSAVGMAGLWSPHFSPLYNAMEDIRVNYAMSLVRPGVRVMLKALHMRVLNEGAKLGTFDADGNENVLIWSDAPLDAQIAVAALCEGLDYPYQNNFSPTVVKALKDEDLREAIHSIKECRNALETLEVTFQILTEMRRLGFFQTEEDQADEDKREEDGESSDSGERGDDGGDEQSEDSGGFGSPSGSKVGNSDPEEDSDSSDLDSDVESDEAEQGNDGSNRDDDVSDCGEADESDDSSDESGDSDGSGPGEESDRDGDESLEDNKDEISPQELVEIIEKFLGHTSKVMIDSGEEADAEDEDDVRVLRELLDECERADFSGLLRVAESQFKHFETSSVKVKGVSHVNFDPSNFRYGWEDGEKSSDSVAVHEDILQPALLETRVVFAENARAKKQNNLRSGKIKAGSLGKRAPVDDGRLFYRKTLPGKRDYFVAIAIDISGSTMGENIKLIRDAVLAQATLLHRVGVKFEVFAHTTCYEENQYDREPYLAIHHIKDANEQWSTETITRLASLDAYAGNLDGHALEYLRKRLDESSATTKIGLYYSDGAMPAENYHEELEILKRELEICKKRNYTLLGVGINTNSPEKHGMETVVVREYSDVRAVIKQIESKLVNR